MISNDTCWITFSISTEGWALQLEITTLAADSHNLYQRALGSKEWTYSDAVGWGNISLCHLGHMFRNSLDIDGWMLYLTDSWLVAFGFDNLAPQKCLGCGSIGLWLSWELLLLLPSLAVLGAPVRLPMALATSWQTGGWRWSTAKPNLRIAIPEWQCGHIQAR